jgi:hypothetical protein
MPTRKIPRGQRTRKPGAASIPVSLIENLTEHIADRHSTLTDDERLIIACWIIGTYFYEPWDGWFPYLHIASLMPNAGKSTIGKAIRDLAYEPKMIFPTVAAMARFKSAGYHTLIIDEIHHLLTSRNTDREKFYAIANMGNEPGSSEAIAGEMPDDLQMRDMYYPKVWIGIGPGILETALASRGIRIIVMPGNASDQIERERRQSIRPAEIMVPRLRAMLTGLRDSAVISDAIRAGKLSIKTRTLNHGTVIVNRDADNWRILITIADLASDECGKRMREIAYRYENQEPEPTETMADQIDAAIKSVMRAKLLTVSNWAHGREPLPADNFPMTNEDFGWPRPRGGLRGRLPEGTLICNAGSETAELRFKASEFSEICNALPNGPWAKRDVTRAYQDAGRLHAATGRTSIRTPFKSGQGDMTCICISVSNWLWPSEPTVTKSDNPWE